MLPLPARGGAGRYSRGNPHTSATVPRGILVDVQRFWRSDAPERECRGATQRRLVRAAQKIIGEKVHSIGRLEFPEYLRGMTVLTVEAIDRGQLDALDDAIHHPPIRK